ncbi:MAG: VWA domain-containing protein, partial [Thermoanaerobaculia bacterium]|nr:VWA domain-containing protein [Thermoanaerobaculia bacterium]
RLQTIHAANRLFRAIRVRGEVRDEEDVIDRFRYDYELPPDRESIALSIERFLPPYDYQLVIQVTDHGSSAKGYLTMPLEVPYFKPERYETLGEERDAVVAEMEQNFREGESTVRLVPLGRGFFTGRQRFETLVTGDEIESVEFYVDDAKVMSKREPPYTLELDLGEIPLMTKIQAIGRNHLGEIVSADELVVNAGSDPFRVRIVSPRISHGLEGEVRVEVEATVPAEYDLETLELYLDENRIAVGYESPLIQTINIPSGAAPTYLRAVATIDDEIGSSAEDVVLLNAPELLEEVDVRLVELPTTVTRRGEIVDDLTIDAFEVLDEGRPVEIDKFEYVRDLSLSIGVAIDSSGSMQPKMSEALKTGARFFERVMKAGDRAFLLAFNDEPRLIQGWTDSLANLTAGLATLDAEEMTALHDAIIHSLYNFQGLRGQKALIIVSDGQDTASQFSWDQVKEYARQTGIPIYTIGIGIRRDDSDTRAKLRQISDETGAESYFVEGSSELRGPFEEIEQELRSQYILGFYPPKSARDSGEWRRVEVTVEGARAKTVRGYYP